MNALEILQHQRERRTQNNNNGYIETVKTFFQGWPTVTMLVETDDEIVMDYVVSNDIVAAKTLMDGYEYEIRAYRTTLGLWSVAIYAPADDEYVQSEQHENLEDAFIKLIYEVNIVPA